MLMNLTLRASWVVQAWYKFTKKARDCSNWLTAK